MKKIINFIKKYKWIIIAITTFLLFVIIAYNITKNGHSFLDKNLHDLIKPHISNSLTSFFKIVTFLSSSIFLIISCLISFIVFKNKKYSLYIIINMIIIVLLNTLLKNIFGRPRPEDIMLVKETSYSFPSGHSMASLAFYGFFTYLIWQTKWQRKIKIILTIALSSLVLLIGFSRIYLGVHFPSDVIGGFSLATSYLIIYILIISKHLKKSVS